MAFLPVLGKILGAVTGIGNIASGASAGRADARAKEFEYLQKQDQAALDRARLARQGQLDLAQLGMSQAQLASALRDADADRAVRGGKLQGLQDATISGLPDYIKSRMPTISGGPRPSAVANKEQIGKALQEEALSALLAGRSFNTPTLADIPGVTPAPKAGKLDKFLNIVGGIGAGAGAASMARDAFAAPSPYIPPAQQIPSERKPNPIDPRQVQFGGPR